MRSLEDSVFYRRAFDEDYYDVHIEKYDDAVAAGAIPVPGGELVRVLRGIGLRIPAKERIAATIRTLRYQWRDLGIGRDDLREELLRRWSEPHRIYHTPVRLGRPTFRLTLGSAGRLAHPDLARR